MKKKKKLNLILQDKFIVSNNLLQNCSNGKLNYEMKYF